MHTRLLSWLIFGAMFAVVALRAQAPATASVGQGKFDQEGQVEVVKLSGKVDMVLNGQTTALKLNDRVPQKAKIVTAIDASVVLAFSNGASTQLGSDTELVIDEYLQDPFAETVKVAALTDEPTVSRTKLSLNRGELVGNVKKLKYERGSSFSVQTPVGAAGIRGTTFRIVFRPQGTGQAFFTLSTASGIVAFEHPNAGPSGATTTTPAQSTPAPGNSPQADPAAQGQGGVSASGTAGLPVPQGQEIAILVNVTQNAQGQLVVTTLPPPPTSTSGISAANLQAVTQVAADIAVAVQQIVFSPPPPNPSTPSGSGQGGTGSTQSNEPASGTPGESTTGTKTGSASDSSTGSPGNQGQAANISGSNFTGQVTPPAQTPATQAVRRSTTTSEP